MTVQAHVIPGIGDRQPARGDGHMGIHELSVANGDGSSYSALVGQYGPDGREGRGRQLRCRCRLVHGRLGQRLVRDLVAGRGQALGVATSNRRNEVIDSYAP